MGFQMIFLFGDSLCVFNFSDHRAIPSYSFCWNCTEEAHCPVDCETVSKWIMKNNAKSENMNRILANSKPCPKCKRPIKNNQGCMHMTFNPLANMSFVGCASANGEIMEKELVAFMLATFYEWHAGSVAELMSDCF